MKQLLEQADAAVKRAYAHQGPKHTVDARECTVDYDIRQEEYDNCVAAYRACRQAFERLSDNEKSNFSFSMLSLRHSLYADYMGLTYVKEHPTKRERDMHEHDRECADTYALMFGFQ